jgi:hypothetical protein
VIEIEPKPPAGTFPVGKARPMVPVRVSDIGPLVAGSKNLAREKAVREDIVVGDVCVIFEDRQTYGPRILHCQSGKLLPGYYADFLLFHYTADVQRVVIAKPEN